MKTLFLKNVMPFAVVAMGVSGAFFTTSMQSVSKVKPPQIGYTLNAQGGCSDIAVNCDNTPRPFVCRLAGASGPQAFGKDAQGNCVQILWRPQ
jgi:hypothetical protein